MNSKTSSIRENRGKGDISGGASRYEGFGGKPSSRRPVTRHKRPSPVCPWLLRDASRSASPFSTHMGTSPRSFPEETTRLILNSLLVTFRSDDQSRTLNVVLSGRFKINRNFYFIQRDASLRERARSLSKDPKKGLGSTDCGFGRSRAGRAEAVTAFHAELSGTRLPACLLHRLFIHITRAFHVLHPARHYASPSSLPSPSPSNRIDLTVSSFFAPSSHMPPPSSSIRVCVSSSSLSPFASLENLNV